MTYRMSYDNPTRPFWRQLGASGDNWLTRLPAGVKAVGIAVVLGSLVLHGLRGGDVSALVFGTVMMGLTLYLAYQLVRWVYDAFNVRVPMWLFLPVYLAFFPVALLLTAATWIFVVLKSLGEQMRNAA